MTSTAFLSQVSYADKRKRALIQFFPLLKTLGWRTDGPVPWIQLPLVCRAGLLAHIQALEECPGLGSL